MGAAYSAPVPLGAGAGGDLFNFLLQVLVLLGQLGQGEQLVHRAEAAGEGAQHQRGNNKQQAFFLHFKTLRGQNVTESGNGKIAAPALRIQKLSYHISLLFGMVICKFYVSCGCG